MAEFSKTLLDMLVEFMVCEIGSKAIDGITYAMLLKTDKDKKTYDRYMSIRQEATNCGYSNEDIFRVYQVSNGYIFDMDLVTAKQIIAEMSKSVAKHNGGKTPVGELLKDRPDQRRKRDIAGLASYLKSEYDKGTRQLEVALFSRNSTNKIVVHGTGPKGEAMCIKYNAYAIRHWDIETLNESFLIPAGFRVKSIQPCEILPYKTGVSFIFKMESMQEFNTSIDRK